MRRAPLAVAFVLAVAAWLAPAVLAQTDVVVGVPVRDGQVGKPQPGVIIDVGPRESQRVPPPVAVPEVGREGVPSTVRPQFGGGYAIETPGEPTTTVRPRFGGGYTVEKDGKTTTEVKPTFGGGYTVERSADSPVIVVPTSPRGVDRRP